MYTSLPVRERRVFCHFINYIYSWQKQNASSLMVKMKIGGSILAQIKNAVLSKIALFVILESHSPT